MQRENGTETLFLVEEADEGGYVARAVGESIFTQGETEEEIRANVKEAVETHFNEGEGPRVIRLHFVRDEVIPV